MQTAKSDKLGFYMSTAAFIIREGEYGKTTTARLSTWVGAESMEEKAISCTLRDANRYLRMGRRDF